jgi:hypothetical protein
MVLFIRNREKHIGGYYMSVDTEIFNKVLTDFAEHFSVGDKKQIILVLDQAGWHTAKKVNIPQGIHIVEMPSHSPEQQRC